MADGRIAPSGDLGIVVKRADGTEEFPLDGPQPPAELADENVKLKHIAPHALPNDKLPREVNEFRIANWRYLWRGLWRAKLARGMSRRLQIPTLYGSLYLRKFDERKQEWLNLGLAGFKVVTDNGAGYLVDALEQIEPGQMKFHGFGTGTTAEGATDTALVTELTTQYATDSTRPTGTSTESSQKVYQTVGTLSPDSGFTISLREHGVFSASSAGVLLDRTVHSAVTMDVSGDSEQATYTLTINSGS